MSTYCRQSKIMLVILLIWAPTLSGCGAGNPNQLSEPYSDPQDSSVNSPSQPSGPDDPVSGQPGQGGNAALGNTVQGRVTDAAGQPLAEVIVTPQSTDTPPQAVPEIAVFTDDQGRFQWTLPPGSYNLTFSREGYESLTKAVVVKQQPTLLDIVLQQQ